MSTMLNDGEMNDTEYVYPGTLSDSGLQDEMGEAIVMDANGMCYQKDGERSYQAIGNLYDLQDNLQDGENLNSVSMLPLASNPYNSMGNLY